MLGWLGLGCLHQREKCSSSSSSSSNPFSPPFSLYFQRNFRHSFTIFPPATRSQSGTFLCVLAPKVEQPLNGGCCKFVQCPMCNHLYQMYNALWSIVPNVQFYIVICTKHIMPFGTMHYGRLYQICNARWSTVPNVQCRMVPCPMVEYE